MRAAFAVWNDRIAPVFDAAQQAHLIDADAGRIVGVQVDTLPHDVPVERARWLAAQRVNVLVCGAISRPLQALVESYGIQVVPFVTGELNMVVSAWLAGTLPGSQFLMPGCGGWRRGVRRPGGGPGRRGGGWAGRGGGVGGGAGNRRRGAR